MITATFYQYDGHPDTVNKTLTGGVDVSGVLRDDYNVLNPRLTVRRKEGMPFNMCYIPVFKRYYRVDGVIQIDNDRFNVVMTVDVLKTYESKIMEATATITESDNPNPHISNRNTVYDRRPNFQKVDFPNTGLLDEEGSIIMVTIKGDK